MELAVTAPHDGTVQAVTVSVGEHVAQGQAQVELEAVET